MTTYYVGKGGNDSNSGVDWANRRLTITSGISLVASAGDILRVGPGVYPEAVTLPISGTSGARCKLLGDPSGRWTDGVGGLVKITGSDDDEATATRNRVIVIFDVSYWDISGFVIGRATDHRVYGGGSSAHIRLTNLIGLGDGKRPISMQTTADVGVDWYVGQSIFYNTGEAVVFEAQGGDDTADAGHVVEGCLFFGGSLASIYVNHSSGPLVMGCGFMGGARGIQGSPASGFPIIARNNWFQGLNQAIQQDVAGATDVDYCAFCGNNNVGSTTTDGGHNLPSAAFSGSQLAELGFESWPLHGDGHPPRFWPFSLAAGSPLLNVGDDGTHVPAVDLYGLPRPLGLASNVGPVEAAASFVTRNATVVETGSYSRELPTRGVCYLPIQCNAGENIVVTAKVKWDADASIGVKPSMTLLEAPGFSDMTDSGAGDGTTAWDTLTTGTLTPTFTGIAWLRLQNNNTDSSDHSVYFDTVAVTRG